jgi:ABC-type Na+ transport system ATPase subunit NatA
MGQERSNPRVAASGPLTVSNLSKTYDGGVVALRDVSFTVHQGEVFGLLGPNGAGKTTTLGVLTTLVRPTGGQACVGGFDVAADPLGVRRTIGVLFQDSVLDVAFSGEQNLWLHARLWRVPDARQRIVSLLARVGLTDRAADPVGSYSGGMKRRLEIARALLGEPELLILDEPTLGLDPISRAELWDAVRVLCRERGVTVLVSTHYLEEAHGVAELLVYTIKQPQVFGTLIPAIGATPYLLSGAIYPLTALPDGIRVVAWALPWTHCVALLRYALLGDAASGLHDIWPFADVTVMALGSMIFLLLAAALTQWLSHRRFAATVSR